MKVLLTTTSFQDTPGPHHEVLSQQGWEITTLRGPLNADVLLPIIAEFDGIICGDDEYSEEVIRIGVEGKLKCISKYGVGLDRVDLDVAREVGLQVVNCPSVNQVSVAEHVLALLLSLYRHIPQELEHTRAGRWTRLVGNELSGKKLGVMGFGSVGKETAKKAFALGLEVYVVDKFMDRSMAERYGFHVQETIEDLFRQCDIISLHVPHTPETDELVHQGLFEAYGREDLVLVNTARGKLVNNAAILRAIDSGKLRAYLCDVLEEEPMAENHPFAQAEGVWITPHVGSRTYESVARQGTMAVENLARELAKME